MRLIDADKLMAEETAAFTRAQFMLGRQNGKQLSSSQMLAEITINQIVHGKLHCLIRDTPTVEPEQKRGRWVIKKKTVDGLIWYEYECSECKLWAVIKTPFCPWCGAKMEQPGKDGERREK